MARVGANENQIRNGIGDLLYCLAGFECGQVVVFHPTRSRELLCCPDWVADWTAEGKRLLSRSLMPRAYDYANTDPNRR
jgi:hypothetical protein